MYEWDLTNTQASYAHSSLIFGMMVGAIFWGFFSDVKGRKPTFNITLFVTGAFGIASAFAPNFVVLCVLMFLLGTGLGGNLPVDGTLLLEFIPQSRQNLLTLLVKNIHTRSLTSKLTISERVLAPWSTCYSFIRMDSVTQIFLFI